MNIEEIVKGYEQKYGGGKEFFDAMDAALCCEDIYTRLYDMVKDPFRFTFILTGTFGMQFYRWMCRNDKRRAGVILFPGGMRDGVAKSPTLIQLSNPDHWTDRACFLDDSYFGGGTRSGCIQILAVSNQLESIVAYDGSHKRPRWLRSLYRYHQDQGEVDTDTGGGRPGVNFSACLSEIESFVWPEGEV